MSAISAKTASAITSVSHLKAESPNCFPAFFCLSWSTFFSLKKIKRTKSGRNYALRPTHAHKLSGGGAMSSFNCVEHFQFALLDFVRQRRVVERGRNFLAFGDRPF